jgi:hypothetical protein
MKVCDLHRDRPAIDTLRFSLDDQHIDVCEQCRNAVFSALNPPQPPQPAAPPINRASSSPLVPPRRVARTSEVSKTLKESQ